MDLKIFKVFTSSKRCYNFSMLNEEHFWEFPGSPVVKNPSCNAADMGSIPGQGTKISHDAGQLSLLATTTEPTYHN